MELREKLQTLLGDAYQIERELGGGGMSRVFAATETALGRKVVIKVLPAELGAGVNVERFKREIQVAANLQHPHIVPVLTAGEIDGRAVLHDAVHRRRIVARASRARVRCRSTSASRCCATSRARSRTRTSTASSTATSSPTTC